MARFRLRSRVSIEIDDLRLTASITIGGSTPHRPTRHEVCDYCDLAAELAEYKTPSDVLDLQAALDRYDDADTHDIRAILDTQARHRLTSPRGHSPDR
jgi:hypothetical protein